MSSDWLSWFSFEITQKKKKRTFTLITNRAYNVWSNVCMNLLVQCNGIKFDQQAKQKLTKERKKQIEWIEGIKMSHFIVRFRNLLLNELLKMLSSSRVEQFIYFLQMAFDIFDIIPNILEAFSVPSIVVVHVRCRWTNNSQGYDSYLWNELRGLFTVPFSYWCFVQFAVTTFKLSKEAEHRAPSISIKFQHQVHHFFILSLFPLQFSMMK